MMSLLVQTYIFSNSYSLFFGALKKAISLSSVKLKDLR